MPRLLEQFIHITTKKINIKKGFSDIENDVLEIEKRILEEALPEA